VASLALGLAQPRAFFVNVASFPLNEQPKIMVEKARPLTLGERPPGQRVIVERSTTGAYWMDEVETARTEWHLRRSAGPRSTKPLTLPR
jgi:hypothetical protein